ncbi:hypothetical protein Hanom_Chr07g00656101 [Helianthus anomalus]
MFKKIVKLTIFNYYYLSLLREILWYLVFVEETVSSEIPLFLLIKQLLLTLCI